MSDVVRLAGFDRPSGWCQGNGFIRAHKWQSREVGGFTKRTDDQFEAHAQLSCGGACHRGLTYTWSSTKGQREIVSETGMDYFGNRTHLLTSSTLEAVADFASASIRVARAQSSGFQ